MEPRTSGMVVIDASFLLLMINPGAGAPVGVDGKLIVRAKDRIDLLIEGLAHSKTKVLVPTPALSEALVRAGASLSQKIVDTLQRHSAFRIEPFDARAAIEVAAMTRDALQRGGKKGQSSSVWAKVKYDRQIVAIARVNGAAIIYSDDGDIRALAKRANIEVLGVGDLPLPAEDAQLDLTLTPKLGDKSEEGE